MGVARKSVIAIHDNPAAVMPEQFERAMHVCDRDPSLLVREPIGRSENGPWGKVEKRTRWICRPNREIQMPPESLGKTRRSWGGKAPHELGFPTEVEEDPAKGWRQVEARLLGH